MLLSFQEKASANSVNLPAPSFTTLNSEIIISGCELLLDNGECLIFQTDESHQKIQLWSPLKDLTNFSVKINSQTVDLSDLFENKKKTKSNLLTISKNTKGTLIEIPIRQNKNNFTLINSKQSYRWSLTVNLLETPTWLKKTRELRKQRKVKLLKEQLVALEDSLPDIELAYKYYYLGRVFIALDQLDQAIDSVKRSSAHFRKITARNKILDNQTLLSYIYLQLNDDLVNAKQVIDNLESVSNDGLSTFYQNYYQGALYTYLGDLRKAEKHIKNAIQIATAFNFNEKILDADFLYSNILVESGRITEAIEIRETILSKANKYDDNCKKVIYLDGLAWAQLQQIDSLYGVKENTSIDPLSSLNQALSIAESHCPERKSMHVNILLNLAMAHLLDNKIQSAKQLIEKVDAMKVPLSYRQKLDLLEMQGKLSLLDKNSNKALHSFSQLLKYSESTKYSIFMIKALVGLAETYQLLDENHAAREHYARATDLIFGHSLGIPVTASQPNFISKLSRFSKKYVDFLYQTNRIDEALQVTRRFRAGWLQDLFQLSQIHSQKLSKNPVWLSTLSKIRKVRSAIINQQSISWTLPQNQLLQSNIELKEKEQELAQLFDLAISLVNETSTTEYAGYANPKPNELFLFFYPVENGWLGFAKAERSLKSHFISSHHSSSLSPENMAQEWITAFEGEIESNDILKVYPFGILKNVDFQALVFQNELLLSRKSIHYGVDLSHKKITQVKQTQVSRSLVVANSLGDLRETELEANQIIQITKPFNWENNLLTTSQTKFTRIKNQLQRSQHFHYAGHVFDNKTSTSQYLLPLADNTYLDSNDIIILERAPKWVVLSACNSAKNNSTVNTESLGLAQAFIMSGSKQVIASSRPVLDKHTRTLMTKFYQHWTESGDFAESLRTAQLNLIRNQPEADWLAFRILIL